jgi:hypothetical protein
MTKTFYLLLGVGIVALTAVAPEQAIAQGEGKYAASPAASGAGPASGSPVNARKKKRRVELRNYAPSYHVPKQEAECARARHKDPTGAYAGHPCWAQEALGAGSRGRR